MNKKANDIFSTIFLIIMLGFLCFASFKVFSGNSDEPRFICGYRLIYLTSGSMEPAIKTNAMALTHEVDSMDDINVGDIISFRVEQENGDYIRATHRIVDINQEAGLITTKGDNNRVIDSFPISIKNIESKVVLTMNWTAYVVAFISGFINMFNTNPFIQLLSIVIILLIILYFTVKKLNKKPKQEERSEKNGKR